MNLARQDVVDAARLARVRDYFRQVVERRELPPLPLPSPEILHAFALDDDEALQQTAGAVLRAFNVESALLKSA